MSAAPVADAAPKKKGKMPVIIAMVALLGGGGFFVMKGKGGKKVVPKVKLGPISDIKDEFLVNLKDSSSSYLRVSVSLQFADGTKAEEVEKSLSAIQDIINARLRAETISDVKSLDGAKLLKREIAADINDVIGEKKDDADADADKDSKSDKSDSSDKDSDSKGKSDKADDDKKLLNDKTIPTGWDAAKGPVLKVLFRSFAYQQ